jgi:hypothetical protein
LEKIKNKPVKKTHKSKIVHKVIDKPEHWVQDRVGSHERTRKFIVKKCGIKKLDLRHATGIFQSFWAFEQLPNAQKPKFHRCGKTMKLSAGHSSQSLNQS